MFMLTLRYTLDICKLFFSYSLGRQILHSSALCLLVGANFIFRP